VGLKRSASPAKLPDCSNQANTLPALGVLVIVVGTLYTNSEKKSSCDMAGGCWLMLVDAG
jgi:hypothetical protein